jgi:hypothetical protein
MKHEYIENKIIIRAIQGMLISEGHIRKDNSKGFLSCFPGRVPYAANTLEELRIQVEEEAKEYYGDDVVAEIIPLQVINR